MIEQAKTALSGPGRKAASDADLGRHLDVRGETIGRWRKLGTTLANARRLQDIAQGTEKPPAAPPWALGTGRSVGSLPIYVERLFNLTPDYFASLDASQRRDLIRMMELSLGSMPSSGAAGGGNGEATRADRGGRTRGSPGNRRREDGAPGVMPSGVGGG